VPPLALLSCRKSWRAGVAWLAIVALVATIPNSWGFLGLLLVSVPEMLWALYAVDRPVAAGQTARRIRAA